MSMPYVFYFLLNIDGVLLILVFVPSVWKESDVGLQQRAMCWLINLTKTRFFKRVISNLPNINLFQDSLHLILGYSFWACWWGIIVLGSNDLPDIVIDFKPYASVYLLHDLDVNFCCETLRNRQIKIWKANACILFISFWKQLIILLKYQINVLFYVNINALFVGAHAILLQYGCVTADIIFNRILKSLFWYVMLLQYLVFHLNAFLLKSFLNLLYQRV